MPEHIQITVGSWVPIGRNSLLVRLVLGFAGLPRQDQEVILAVFACAGHLTNIGTHQPTASLDEYLRAADCKTSWPDPNAKPTRAKRKQTFRHSSCLLPSAPSGDNPRPPASNKRKTDQHDKNRSVRQRPSSSGRKTDAASTVSYVASSAEQIGVHPSSAFIQGENLGPCVVGRSHNQVTEVRSSSARYCSGRSGSSVRRPDMVAISNIDRCSYASCLSPLVPPGDQQPHASNKRGMTTQQ